MKTLEFRLRKVQASSDIEKRLQFFKKQPSRVYVNEEALIELTGGKDGGKAIIIERSSATDATPVRREASLWKAPEKLDKSVALMYDVFSAACGYKLGESVKITALGGALPDADEVVFKEIPKEAAGDREAPPALEPIPSDEIPAWEVFLAGRLSLIEHVHAGMTFKNVFFRGPERSFVVASVNGNSFGNSRYVDRKATIRIQLEEIEETPTSGVFEVTGVRGLDVQVSQLNDLLRCFTMDEKLRWKNPHPNIVIHGGHGTGKSMLLSKIAATGWGTVFRIQPKDKLSEIQETFQKAKLQQPSIILIDQFERLVDKERNNRNAVITSICDALDGFAAEAETKGVAPSVAVIAACLDYTTEIPEDLKEPDRFDEEIYLPIPDAEGRKKILTSLGLDIFTEEEEDTICQLSERTHAYTGKDLKRLVRKGRRLGAIRADKLAASLPKIDSVDGEANSGTPQIPAAETDATNADALTTTLSTLTLTPPAPTPTTSPSDYQAALKLVRPSAMHDINLKPPPIRFADIGGQEAVKTSLRRAVRLSSESPQILSRYFDRPPKGFLLYGPPGCSKTMAAQAMATESGLNFFAVKGAELLNMYVGESERAVRRLFQRAREVAPSMIFFDEIDSIAGQRHGFGSDKSTTSHGGLNVLTTLLNEMDGFEALQGVVVLAATNRPQALDPALLRPGRFDELIYVSPPDREARKAIFMGVAARKRMHKDVDVDMLARETEGYSGAEIKGICAAAGVAAYDRYLMRGGDEVDDDGGIRMEDLERAVRNQKRQITAEMIRGFEEWERQFRRH
ncbi:hypothetical protein OQA88_12818 [Cercophora sp. LCS_1]